MLSLTSLWMPIVLTSVLIFFASSLIHMVFKWHNSEYRKLPNEDEVRAVINKAQLVPGQYVMPHCLDGSDFKKPELQQKFVEGPIAFLVLRQSGMPKMGKQLGQWFAFTLALAAVVGCLAACVLPAGAGRHAVFHLVAMVTLLAYGSGSVVNSIWMGRPWSATAKELLDAAIYAGLSGAAFAWLWPAA